MLSPLHVSATETARFVEDHGIDVGLDKASLLKPFGTEIRPLLAQLDEVGSTAEHCTDTGADYFFSRLDYCRTNTSTVLASRYIATILGGNRTELAYWTKDAPAKSLTVHQGLGALVVSDPNTQRTTAFTLDPEVTPEVTLPAERFYTFEADPATPKPLVVSGLYFEEPNWSRLEIPVEPCQEAVYITKSDGGRCPVRIPTEFANRY